MQQYNNLKNMDTKSFSAQRTTNLKQNIEFKEI